MKKNFIKKVTMFSAALIATVCLFNTGVKASQDKTTTGKTTADVRTLTVARESNGSKQDGTLIKLTKGSTKTVIVFDAGFNALVQDGKLNPDLRAAAYDSGNKTLTIDYLIISHAHQDHYMGITELRAWAGNNSDKKVVIKNLYVNGYFTDSSSLSHLDEKLTNLVKKSNVTLKNLYVMNKKGDEKDGNAVKRNVFSELRGQKSATFVSKVVIKHLCDDELSLYILPSLGDIDPNNPKDTTNNYSHRENNESMTVVLRDMTKDKNGYTKGFAYYFLADLEEAGFKKYMESATGYKKYFACVDSAVKVDRTSSRSIYKAGHHGCRENGFEKNESEFIAKVMKPTVIVGTNWARSGLTITLEKIRNEYIPKMMDYIKGDLKIADYSTPYVWKWFSTAAYDPQAKK